MIYLNDKPLNVTIFSDLTSQVWKLPEETFSADFVRIRWDFQNEGEFMQLAQLKMLLDVKHVEAVLHISYLPYARQDKEVSNKSTFALHTFARLLNMLDFKLITIQDPHSNEALRLIDGAYASYPIDKVVEAIKATECDLLCYPDKGAKDKYTVEYQELNIPYIYGEKRRDQLTGEILSHHVIGNPKDKKVMIVDDLVDFGRTFIHLTEYLLQAGAKEVNLFASHGLFSGGTRILFDSGIKRIFTKTGEVSPRTGELGL